MTAGTDHVPTFYPASLYDVYAEPYDITPTQSQRLLVDIRAHFVTDPQRKHMLDVINTAGITHGLDPIKWTRGLCCSPIAKQLLLKLYGRLVG